MTSSFDNKRHADADHGGKGSATPRSAAPVSAGIAVSSLHSATAVQDSHSLTRAGWIALIFCLLVSAAMLYQHFRAAERDPWKSPQLLALKEKLRATPTDESLRSEIRRLDLEFRQRYFRRLALNVTGGWLLVGGVVALLYASKTSRRLVQQPPMPPRRGAVKPAVPRAVSRARWSVAGVGTLVGAGLLALALTGRSLLPERPEDLDKILGRGEGALSDAPSLAEFQANWPQFRRPDAGGVAASGGWNLRFGKAPDAGVLWKSSVPAPGFNSPVVWGNRVFISGGNAEKREVFCFDSTDGKLLWQRAVENVPGSPAKQPEIPEMTGVAAATMACDGRRAFAIFANGDLAAFTVEGAPAWSKHLGVPKNAYGHAASLAIWPGKLIVQWDQEDGAPGGSKLLAFDCTTGRLLWERTKPTHDSWASPIIFEAAGKTQIVSLALPFVMSHSLADGNELWRAELMEGEVTPSPIFAGGLVIAVSPSYGLIALRPDGSGDVKTSHLIWENDENLPDVTSPASNGELVFTVTSAGLLTCFDAKDGKKIWEKDFEMEVQASPAIAGNQLLLLSTQGDAVTVEASRTFAELGRVKLEDRFDASPALVDGRIYLRGMTNLWCLGFNNAN
jgi:outer membrane protein assembly factor BamB